MWEEEKPTRIRHLAVKMPPRIFTRKRDFTVLSSSQKYSISWQRFWLTDRQTGSVKFPEAAALLHNPVQTEQAHKTTEPNTNLSATRKAHPQIAIVSYKQLCCYHPDGYQRKPPDLCILVSGCVEETQPQTQLLQKKNLGLYTEFRLMALG